MRFAPKGLLAPVILLTTVSCLSACVATTGAKHGPAKSDDGSILASIGGISDDELKNAGFAFTLNCAAGTVTVTGEQKGDSIRFDGSKIKEGDPCSMEIRSDKWAKATDEYDWYGRDANKQPIPGLAYASDEKPVASRKLALTLFKLYDVHPADAFTAVINVAFELDAAPATVTAANLVCGTDLTYAGKYTKSADPKDPKGAVLTFKPSVEKLKGKTCAKVAVLIGDKDSGKTYAAQPTDLTFDAPEKGKTTTMPKDPKARYTLVLVAAGDVTVDTQLCLHFDTSTPKPYKCQDVTAVKTPAASILLAKIEGKIGEQTRTYYAAKGEKGLGVFTGTELNIKLLNDALKKDAAAAAKFVWYKEDAGDALMKAPFNDDLLAGTGHAGDLASADELASFTALNIVSVHMHGFAPVASLDPDQKDLHWLGVVTATKDTEKTVNLIVTGSDDFFSAAAPYTDDQGKKAFFNFAQMNTEMNGNGSDKWRLYSTKDAVMAVAGCTALNAAAYVDSLSLVAESGLKLTADSDLGKCELKSPNYKPDLKDYKAAVDYYVWGWSDLKLSN